MNTPNIVKMAQGYMKLECIPDHIGANWRALVKITDDQGVTTWKDVETGDIFVPDDSGMYWTDASTDVVYESVQETPFWFSIDKDHIYVVEDDKDMKPIPIYEWPNIQDMSESERGVLYWNFFSLSGITDPYLIRFVNLKDGVTREEFEKNTLVGVWGTDSYRTVMSPHKDEESDETEIP